MTKRNKKSDKFRAKKGFPYRKSIIETPEEISQELDKMVKEIMCIECGIRKATIHKFCKICDPSKDSEFD